MGRKQWRIEDNKTTNARHDARSGLFADNGGKMRGSDKVNPFCDRRAFILILVMTSLRISSAFETYIHPVIYNLP